jgi:hypothetical protein
LFRVLIPIPVLAKHPFSTLNLLYRVTAGPNCLPEPSASLAHLLPPAAGHTRSTRAGAGAEVSSSHQPLLHGGDGLGQQLVRGRRRSPVRRLSSPPRGQRPSPASCRACPRGRHGAASGTLPHAGRAGSAQMESPARPSALTRQLQSLPTRPARRVRWH